METKHWASTNVFCGGKYYHDYKSTLHWHHKFRWIAPKYEIFCADVITSFPGKIFEHAHNVSPEMEVWDTIVDIFQRKVFSKKPKARFDLYKVTTLFSKTDSSFVSRDGQSVFFLKFIGVELFEYKISMALLHGHPNESDYIISALHVRWERSHSLSMVKRKLFQGE